MVRKLFNLELDIRSADWVVKNVRSDRIYAQNLYAAMCNNRFIPLTHCFYILTNKGWVCESWSYAARMIADIRENDGEFSRFYCSGMRSALTQSNVPQTPIQDGFVAESIVTPQIEEDITKIGWLIKSGTWTLETSD